MKRCPSCDGILGVDCFNPVDCAAITASMNQQCQSCEQLINEINYLRDVDMRDLEQKIQYSCKIVSDLLDIIYDLALSNGMSVGEAEDYYRKNYIKPDEPGSAESNYIDDDLPF